MFAIITDHCTGRVKLLFGKSDVLNADQSQLPSVLSLYMNKEMLSLLSTAAQ